MRYLHFSVGVFFKLLYFLMVQCGGWVLASLHNPVLMRTYALGILEGVFYSKYLHSTRRVCVYLPHSHIRDEQNPAIMAAEAKHCHYGRLLVMQISPPIRHQTPQVLILSCRALPN